MLKVAAIWSSLTSRKHRRKVTALGPAAIGALAGFAIYVGRFWVEVVTTPGTGKIVASVAAAVIAYMFIIRPLYAYHKSTHPTHKENHSS